MKKRHLLTSTALATALLMGKNPIINSNANAQIKNFSGPYISLGVGASYDRVDTSNDASNIPTAGAYATSSLLVAQFIGFNSAAATIIGRAATSIKKENWLQNADVNLGYTFDLGGDFGLGMDLSYNLGKQGRSTSQNYTQSTQANVDVAATGTSHTITNATGSQSIKIKDQYNIAFSLKPSVAVSKDLMVYGIGSVNQLKQKVNVGFNLDTATNYSLSKEVFGYGVGIGARYNVDKNLYFEFSAVNLTYDKYKVSRSDSDVTPVLAGTTQNTAQNSLTTTIDPKYYDIKLAIGYKF